MKNEIRDPGKPNKRVPDQPLELFDGQLLNTKALCKLLNCRPEAITRMITERDGLPHIRIGARHWFDRAAVLEWFQKRQTQRNPTTKRGSR